MSAAEWERRAPGVPSPVRTVPIRGPSAKCPLNVTLLDRDLWGCFVHYDPICKGKLPHSEGGCIWCDCCTRAIYNAFTAAISHPGRRPCVVELSPHAADHVELIRAAHDGRTRGMRLTLTRRNGTARGAVEVKHEGWADPETLEPSFEVVPIVEARFAELVTLRRTLLLAARAVEGEECP